MTKHLLVTMLALAGCGRKTDNAQAAETKTDKAAAPAPSAPATSVEVAQLVGTWTKSDNANVTWTFNADGTTHTKTSVTEFPGTFELAGTALHMKHKGVPAHDYTVLEASVTKLRLKDTNYNDVVEFKR